MNSQPLTRTAEVPTHHNKAFRFWFYFYKDEITNAENVAMCMSLPQLLGLWLSAETTAVDEEAHDRARQSVHRIASIIYGADWMERALVAVQQVNEYALPRLGHNETNV